MFPIIAFDKSRLLSSMTCLRFCMLENNLSDMMILSLNCTVNGVLINCFFNYSKMVGNAQPSFASFHLVITRFNNVSLSTLLFEGNIMFAFKQHTTNTNRLNWNILIQAACNVIFCFATVFLASLKCGWIHSSDVALIQEPGVNFTNNRPCCIIVFRAATFSHHKLESRALSHRAVFGVWLVNGLFI